MQEVCNHFVSLYHYVQFTFIEYVPDRLFDFQNIGCLNIMASKINGSQNNGFQ